MGVLDISPVDLARLNLSLGKYCLWLHQPLTPTIRVPLRCNVAVYVHIDLHIDVLHSALNYSPERPAPETSQSNQATGPTVQQERQEGPYVVT